MDDVDSGVYPVTGHLIPLSAIIPQLQPRFEPFDFEFGFSVELRSDDDLEGIALSQNPVGRHVDGDEIPSFPGDKD